MSKSDAAHYKDAENIAGTEAIWIPTGSTGDFLRSAEVRAGNVYQVPWELFRFVALREAPQKQAAVMLAAWSASEGLTPRLEVRTVAIGDSEHGDLLAPSSDQ
jgi:hypothetical protein